MPRIWEPLKLLGIEPRGSPCEMTLSGKGGKCWTNKFDIGPFPKDSSNERTINSQRTETIIQIASKLSEKNIVAHGVDDEVKNLLLGLVCLTRCKNWRKHIEISQAATFRRWVTIIYNFQLDEKTAAKNAESVLAIQNNSFRKKIPSELFEVLSEPVSKNLPAGATTMILAPKLNGFDVTEIIIQNNEPFMASITDEIHLSATLQTVGNVTTIPHPALYVKSHLRQIRDGLQVTKRFLQSLLQNPISLEKSFLCLDYQITKLTSQPSIPIFSNGLLVIQPPNYLVKEEAEQKPIPERCPICWTRFSFEHEAVWCRRTCGQNFHGQCFLLSLVRGQKLCDAKCPMCRSNWLWE